MAEKHPDLDHTEAPVTLRIYLMCAFAAFGGIFFGYDSGYINGVLGMPYFVRLYTGSTDIPIPTHDKSLITSILSAGTFLGAIAAGDIADFIGRRTTIIAGCVIFIGGVCLQTASTGLGLLVAGRLIAGLGVGFLSAIIILYMSEIAPKRIRGPIVAGYQFCINVGIVLASCVCYATQNLETTASYRIPIAMQMLWSGILGIGLLFLPESPRYFVKRGKLEDASKALARARGQPTESTFVQAELAEIIANYEYECSIIPTSSYFDSWAVCFQGSLRKPQSNLRRTMLGTSAQMMQQFTGINFIFYFGTTFFQTLGTIHNPFLISLVTTLVNMVSTPISFYTIEKFGRRPLMFWGAVGMLSSQLIVAIVGVTAGSGANPSQTAIKAMIAFICIYISFFACTWGPGAWVIVGEVFPLPIRSRGVGLSAASNWFWNCIIAVITPYMVDLDKANLGPKVFFVWGAGCVLCSIWAYFLVFETKGLSLEQIDRMFEENTARSSTKWVPHSTFAADMGIDEKPAYIHNDKAEEA